MLFTKSFWASQEVAIIISGLPENRAFEEKKIKIRRWKNTRETVDVLKILKTNKKRRHSVENPKNFRTTDFSTPLQKSKQALAVWELKVRLRLSWRLKMQIVHKWWGCVPSLLVPIKRFLTNQHLAFLGFGVAKGFNHIDRNTCWSNHDDYDGWLWTYHGKSPTNIAW